MLRILGLGLFAVSLTPVPTMAEVCFGDEKDTEVFVNVEICPASSKRACSVICFTPDLYEMPEAAMTLSRFIVAVGDGGVTFEEAHAVARKKFGTGRYHEIGNVTVEPQLCRNEPASGRIVCDF